MYHKKKIAVFISHIYGNYQSMLCSGIADKAFELGYPLEFYTTNDGEDLGNYGIGEEGFLRIPNFDDIDGAIFASGTYTDHTLKDKITDFLKAKGCPVVEVAEKDPVFDHVTMENNETAGELTKHMVIKHGAKRICYLGHSGESFYSDKREASYKKALASLSIVCGDNDVFLCDETVSSYINALSFFKAAGPFDAVICYNDKVAIGFMDVAKQNGYRIPKDFAITGCDSLESGKYISPSLTSVSFPLTEVGKEAVISLSRLISTGKTESVNVSATPVYRESCGCSADSGNDTFSYLMSRSAKISELEHSMLVSMKMSAQLSHTSDIDEAADIISEYVKNLSDIKDFYICLYPDWDKIDDPIIAFADNRNIASESLEEDAAKEDAMILKLGIQSGKRLPECTFSKSSLLPGFVSADDNRSFVVTPLFFEERSFGYIAMSFINNSISYKFEFVEWVMNIASLLQKSCESKKTGILSKHLEELYLKDPLTGLYNRHGFNTYYDKKNTPSKFKTMVVLDLNRLKYINDTYGHEEGDFALSTIGQALNRSASESDLCARFGGDEFYCFMSHDEDDYPEKFINRTIKFLNNFNTLSSKPYEISASCGFKTVSGLAPFDLGALFKGADEVMYANKKACR